MLTRLQVKGFKNLVDVDVRFGPFTCIAGPNGVGKSNLFDAILFLSKLSNDTLMGAGKKIRGGEDIRGLFSAYGDKTIFMAAEMLIPSTGTDEYSQRAEASATFVRYELKICLQEGADDQLAEEIQIEHESLSYIKKGDARKNLRFSYNKEWLDSIIRVQKRSSPLISTDSEKGVVSLHADRMKSDAKIRRGGGKPATFNLTNLPRTALSSARNAEESRTAVLVRQEMFRWRLLQLEPSALRQPDDFQSANDSMAPSGAHLPATLYRIASTASDNGASRVYANISNRLAELVEGVRKIRVDRDNARRLLTLLMTDRNGLELPASGLSDGTMRFIALAVLQQDPSDTGLVCLEEPENGIHPQRIAAMLQLLNDISVDPEYPVGSDNSLRQVIVTTHSPVVAGRVSEDDLVFAMPRRRRMGEMRIPELHLSCLDSTWRSKAGAESISRGKVMSYLIAEPPEEYREASQKRVLDRFHQGQLDLAFAR